MGNAAGVLYALTIICCWGAFGLGVSSVGAKNWSYTGGTTKRGLWVFCVNNDNCVTLTADATLNAIRAMVIMGISFAFIGTNLISTGYWRRGAIKAAQAGIGFIHLGALCWTVGMILFTVTYDDTNVAWGYPFAFGWANVGLLNIGGGLAHAGVHKRKQQIDSLA